jgi:hypothetical protein
MSTDIDNVKNMLYNSNGITTTPDYRGGVESFYVGAYSESDDVIGGILDNLLSDLIYQDDSEGKLLDKSPSTPVEDTELYSNNDIAAYINNNENDIVIRTSPCKYGDCLVSSDGDEDDSLVINSESSYTYMVESEFIRDTDDSLVVHKKNIPLEIDGGVELTKYSKVRSFIIAYIKEINDKSVKGNK